MQPRCSRDAAALLLQDPDLSTLVCAGRGAEFAWLLVQLSPLALALALCGQPLLALGAARCARAVGGGLRRGEAPLRAAFAAANQLLVGDSSATNRRFIR